MVGLGALATGFGIAGVAGVKFNAQMEGYQTSFEVMTGSAEKASEITERLKVLAAQTPFELPQLADTTQLLMNYGFTADDSMDKMMMLGDISQGSAEKMTRIATAYGQMSSAGKVQLEDVKQMIESGFNPLMEISNSTGESMDSLYDRISKGTISVDEITASMERSTSEGGKYFGSMDKQSQTVNGMLSTLADTVNGKLGDAFQSVSDKVKEILPNVITFVENLDVDAVIKGMGILAGILGTVLTAVTLVRAGFALMNFMTVGGQIVSLGTAISTSLIAPLSALGGFLAPIAGMIAGIIAIIALAIATITDLWNNNEAFKKAMLDAWTSIKDTLSKIWNTVLKPIFDIMMQTFINIWNQGIKPLWDKWTDFVATIAIKMAELWESIKPIVDWFITTFGPMIVSAIKLVADVIGDWVTTAINLFGGLLDNVGQIIGGIIDIFKEIVDFVVGVFTSDWSKAWEEIKTIFGGVFDSLLGIASTPINSIIGLINGMISGVEGGINYLVRAVNTMSFDVPDWVPLIGGESFGFGLSEVSLGRISYLERGGILKKGQVGLLEGKGAEAVIPLDRNKHWLKAQAKELVRYMPQTNDLNGQVINFNQPVQSPDEMARALRLQQRYRLAGA